MCVVFVAMENEPNPTADMLLAGAKGNADGNGIAWREVDTSGKTWVHWKKGLDDEEYIHLATTLPTPLICHSRIASIGGVKSSLTHPFPVEHGASLALEGRTDGYVLAHNGHWSNWDHVMKDAIFKGHLATPDGPWSDTRAMAFLAGHYGVGILDIVIGDSTQNKIVVMSPDRLDSLGKEWKKIDGIWCSNDYWKDQRKKAAGANRGVVQITDQRQLPAHYQQARAGYLQASSEIAKEEPLSGGLSEVVGATNKDESGRLVSMKLLGPARGVAALPDPFPATKAQRKALKRLRRAIQKKHDLPAQEAKALALAQLKEIWNAPPAS